MTVHWACRGAGRSGAGFAPLPPKGAGGEGAPGPRLLSGRGGSFGWPRPGHEVRDHGLGGQGLSLRRYGGGAHGLPVPARRRGSGPGLELHATEDQGDRPQDLPTLSPRARREGQLVGLTRSFDRERDVGFGAAGPPVAIEEEDDVDAFGVPLGVQHGARDGVGAEGVRDPRGAGVEDIEHAVEGGASLGGAGTIAGPCALCA